MVVGGGYAGVEALAELADMARYASRYYPTIDRDDIRWILVEATGRIMPEVSPKMGRYTVERLLDSDIEVNLDTRVKSMVGGHVELDDGQEFDTDTIIWTAGVKPSPMLDKTDLPRDDRGRLDVPRRPSRCSDLPGVFSAGDCAGVPDLSKDDPEARTSPSAQHAVRQAKVLADNVVAHLRAASAQGVQAQLRGLGGEPRAVQGRRGDLRGQAARHRRVVHAPHLPREPHAHLEPPDPDRVRLDGRAVPRAARSCRWGRSTSRRPSSSGSRRRSGRSAPDHGS